MVNHPNNTLIRRIVAIVLIIAAHRENTALGAAPTSLPTTTPAINQLALNIVFPGSRSQGQTDAIVRPPPGCELLKLQASDGTRIAALFAKDRSSRNLATQSTVLFFYGNGMCMAKSLTIFNRLRDLGFNVLMPDYEGYGMSGGPPTEPGCYDAADAVYDWASKQKNVNPNRIIAAGWSLGAAVAIDLASRRPVAGLATFSAFTSMDDMAAVLLQTRGILPIAAILLDCRFDNLAKIPLVTCPIFWPTDHRTSWSRPPCSISLPAPPKAPSRSSACAPQITTTSSKSVATRSTSTSKPSQTNCPIKTQPHGPDHKTLTAPA
jgi:pimeloyl-ACP methyl ester carboxylesterase